MIQSVQRGYQRSFILPDDDALMSEHSGVGAVDIQQSVEKIALGVFEILREHRFGVNAGRKCFGDHSFYDSPRTSAITAPLTD